MTGKVVELAGRKLSLTHLEKVLYPACGFTKAHVLDYYRQLADCILPHLRGRALTMKRYPDGVEQPFFFEKRCPSHRPPWTPTASVTLEHGEALTACLVNDLETLLWVANLAALELHVPLARAATPHTPDAVVFDLDPGPPADILACARVALILRELLGRLGLASWVKSSGQKGLHVFVPLHDSQATFATTKQFTRTVAMLLEKHQPQLVTAKMAKAARTGKVFINWSQNDPALTMICVYSLRAREEPFVSSPLTWEELEECVAADEPARLHILAAQALQRVAAGGDLFRAVLERRQTLPQLAEAERLWEVSFPPSSGLRPPSPSGRRATQETGHAATGLQEYAAKRHFDRTPEPAPAPHPEGRELVFVVHKHAARALHYDLRLELDGVLKSWAIPKGPTLDPAVKRLAVQVEDHPLAYGEFEGVIPEGNYGAGSVIVWDRGVYRHPQARDAAENEQLLRAGLHKGDLKFVLDGTRLHGEFALVRMQREEKSWLLLKKQDRNAAGDDILQQTRSVVSGRTVEELLEADAPQAWGQRKLRQLRRHAVLESPVLHTAPEAPLPHRLKPMLATLARTPFDDPDWLFEVKWDGYRALAELRGGEVALYSRNLLPLHEKFPPIVETLRQLDGAALLDGEIVVVDARGRPDFELLQNYPKSGGHLLYYVFDLLHLGGHDLTGLPLLQRKELLKQLLPPGAKIRYSDHVRKDGNLFFQVARDQGLEGIVAKEAHSTYQAGTRSRQWLKVKTRRTQEGVIAGFTAPRGGRKGLGTLVLGVYRDGELRCIGHAGGGFTGKELEELRARLEPLIQQECPFRTLPPTVTTATWVRPELVCEVEFHGWTSEGVMRQPVFVRLREDKAARDVVREDDQGDER